MKKVLVYLIIIILFSTALHGNMMRKTADFFEFMLIEKFDTLLPLYSQEKGLGVEKLKQISEDLHQKYGFIVSYLSYEMEEEQISFVVQMEKAKLLVRLSFNKNGEVIDLDYQQLEEVTNKDSQVRITTSPASASVYINNIFKGWTPLVITEYPGVYQLDIRKNGFLSLCQTLQLSDRDEVAFNFHLMPAVTIHELDYMRAKSILLNSFDRGGWFKADWVRDNIKHLTLSDTHVTQGTKSLRADFSIQEPSEAIVQYPYSIEPRNLEGAKMFFIDVFLDYEGEVVFSMALQTGEQWQWIESEKHTLKAGMHYALPIRFTGIEDLDDVKILNLKLFIPAPESSGTIYYDNLRYFSEKGE